MTPWLEIAKKHLGQKEYPGKPTNPLIAKWWGLIRSAITDDSSPWCAAFLGGVLEECGILSTRSARARSYEKWGRPLGAPVEGAIAVFWRGSPESKTGHVGFVVGQDKENLQILGGNQGDAVNIRSFPKSRLVALRWPKGYIVPKADLQYTEAPKTTGEA